jgi:carbon-monoxide dehydrogenase medium subunit
LIYGACVKLSSRKGLRILPLDQFILGPGKTALQLGELVRSVVIPLPADGQAATFERLTRRKGVDLATVNVCCQVFESGLVRFAVGAAGPVPFIVEEAESQLVDPALDSMIKKQILNDLMSAAAPISDVRASREYRQAMLVVLARRALERSLERLNS